MKKEKLGQQAAKKKFVESVCRNLNELLRLNKHEDRIGMFSVQDSSIFCDIPADFFRDYEIAPMRIEMKFVVKKG